MEIECLICSTPFDSEQHRPLKIECGIHKLCRACIKGLIESTGVVKCPSCSWTDQRNLEDFEEDQIILSQITKNLLPCYKCGELRATSITDSFEAYCKNCGGKDLNLSQLSSSINRKIMQIYEQFKHLFSYEFKNYIKQSFRKNISKKLELIHLMRLYTCRQDKCAVHPDQNFESLRLVWFRPNCTTCTNDSPSNLVVNLSTIYPVFCNLYIESSKQNSMVYGSVIKAFNGYPDNFWIPIIEAYLMKNYHLNNISLISCMFCSKGFRLGARMPYKMNCGHFICKMCLEGKPRCYCRNGTSEGAVRYDSGDLYKTPKCENCKNTIQMGYGILPYHYICDCVICANCTKNVFGCTTCLSGVFQNSGYKLKVHKRALNILNYLRTDINCWNCQREPAKYISITSSTVLCENCSYGDNQKSLLTSDAEFDISLIQAYGEIIKKFLPNSNFATFSLNKKLYKISYLYSPRVIAGSQKFLETEELDRFNFYYPINENDPRALTVNQNLDFWLGITVDRNVKLCGIRLAGSVRSQEILVDVVIYNAQNPLECKSSKISGKVGYVMFEQAYEMNIYNVLVKYKADDTVYTGKPAKQSVMVKSGITFTFSDPYQKGGELCGPIFGIVYSTDSLDN